MLNQILKWATIAAIWRFIKPRLKSALALIAVLAVTNGVHDEFVEYVQLTDDKNWLLESYILKWFIVIASVVAYVAHNSGIFRKAEPAPRQTSGRKVLDQTNVEKGDDGFDFLRDKRELIRKGDHILAKED